MDHGDIDLPSHLINYTQFYVIGDWRFDKANHILFTSYHGAVQLEFLS